MTPENPFLKFFPETTGRGLYGASPLSPSEVYRGYANNTIIGAIVRDATNVPRYVNQAAEWEVAHFIATQDNPIYEDTPEFKSTTTTEVQEYYPYKEYIVESSLNLMGAQLTGDCTSWMVRLMLDLTRVSRMASGNHERFHKRTASPPYYTNRGHNGEGSNPTRQCELAARIGYVFEQNYGTHDFTDYRSSYRIGMSLGRSDLPSSIISVTSKSKPGRPKIIRSLAGLLDAQRKKYIIGLGSQMAVERTGNPISKFQGSWNHAMGHAGFDQTDWCRSTFGDNVTLIDQSWGEWNRVSNIPDKWKPWGQGMFAVLTKQLTRFIERGECLCYVPDESQGVEVDPVRFY